MSGTHTKRAIQLTLGIAVTALFLWLIARNVDGAGLVDALTGANYGWVALAVAFFLAGYACRIARWRSMLLGSNGAISWGACVTPFMGSIAANNVLPFRAGDVLRVYGLSGHLGVPKSTLLASLLVERLLDLVSLLMALAICLLVFGASSAMSGPILQWGAYGIAAIAVVATLFLLFPALAQKPTMAILAALRPLAPRPVTLVGDFADRLFETLRYLADRRRMAALLLWSVLVWTLEGMVFWATASAIAGIADALVGFMALPIATLATLLPSTPGYVGTFDFFVIQTAQEFGNSPEASTAFALLVHLVLWLPATLIGGAGLALWSIRGRERVTFEKQEKIS